MARLIALFALLALISGIATARTYTTTITTTADENPQLRESTCRERKMLYPQQISHCRMWVETQGGKEHLSPCCTQLSYVTSSCRCDLINKMMQEMMQEQKQFGGQSYGGQSYGGQSYGGGQSMQKMMEMAGMLPSMFCKMDTPRCSMSTPY